MGLLTASPEAPAATADPLRRLGAAASAVEAGHDVRTALIAFGVDASHGYERIHLHALMSVAKLVVYYVASEVQIERDSEEVSGLRGYSDAPFLTISQLRPGRLNVRSITTEYAL